MRERAIGGPLLLVAALTAVAACSSGGGGDDQGGEAAAVPRQTTTPPTTMLLSCEEDPHMVVFDTTGTLTATKEEGLEWLRDPTNVPAVRPLAPELAAAYYDRGYQLLYTTGLPGEYMIGDKPAPEAMMGWLSASGFPVEGTRVETTHTPDPPTELSNDLLVLASSGVELDVGYTDHPDDVQSFQVAGVKEIFMVGEASAGTMSTTIPGDDLAPQVAKVEALPEVCTR